MPFVRYGEPAGDTPVDRVTLTHLPPETNGLARTLVPRVVFEIVDGFVYRSRPRAGGAIPEVEVPPGTRTDLASVPPFLWGFIASYGKHTMAAIVHDVLCDRAKERGDATLRRDADRLFRDAMDEAGVPWAKRWVMWAAVRIAGELGFLGRSVAAAVGGALLAASSAVLAFTLVQVVLAWLRSGELGLPDGRLGLVALVAACLVVLGWLLRATRPMAGAAAIGAVALPPVAAVIGVNVAALLLLWLVSLARWVLSLVGWLLSRVFGSGRADRPPQPPSFGPTRV